MQALLRYSSLVRWTIFQLWDIRTNSNALRFEVDKIASCINVLSYIDGFALVSLCGDDRACDYVDSRYLREFCRRVRQIREPFGRQNAERGRSAFASVATSAPAQCRMRSLRASSPRVHLFRKVRGRSFAVTRIGTTLFGRQFLQFLCS